MIPHNIAPENQPLRNNPHAPPANAAPHWTPKPHVGKKNKVGMPARPRGKALINLPPRTMPNAVSSSSNLSFIPPPPSNPPPPLSPEVVQAPENADRHDLPIPAPVMDNHGLPPPISMDIGIQTADNTPFVPMYRGYAVNVCPQGPPPLPGEMLFTKIQLKAISLFEEEEKRLNALWALENQNWRKIMQWKKEDEELSHLATEVRLANEKVRKEKEEEAKLDTIFKEKLDAVLLPLMTERIPLMIAGMFGTLLQPALVQPPRATCSPGVPPQTPQPPPSNSSLDPPQTSQSPQIPLPPSNSPSSPPQTILVAPTQHANSLPPVGAECVYAPPRRPSRLSMLTADPFGHNEDKPKLPNSSSLQIFSLASKKRKFPTPKAESSTSSASLSNPLPDPVEEPQPTLHDLMDFKPEPYGEPLLPSGQGGNIDLAIFPDNYSLPDFESSDEEEESFLPNKRQRTQ